MVQLISPWSICCVMRLLLTIILRKHVFCPLNFKLKCYQFLLEFLVVSTCQVQFQQSIVSAPLFQCLCLEHLSLFNQKQLDGFECQISFSKTSCVLSSSLMPDFFVLCQKIGALTKLARVTSHTAVTGLTLKSHIWGDTFSYRKGDSFPSKFSFPYDFIPVNSNCLESPEERSSVELFSLLVVHQTCL